MSFIEALARYAFLQNALFSALLASVSCGVIGSLVVARRLTYIAAGIAHAVLGGMGAARYANVVHDITWITPLQGAIVAAILSALAIGIASLQAREREEILISAMWAVGMAGGILFLTFTPGYNEDLMSYLIGNVLMVTAEDLWLLIVLDVTVLAVVYRYYYQLTSLCLDEEFARVRGLRTNLLFLLLVVLIAVTVVLLVSVVGIIMIIALLTIPVAIAARFARNLGHTMLLATLICALLTTLGLAISYTADLPSGPTIILLTGGVYLLLVGALAVARRQGRAV